MQQTRHTYVTELTPVYVYHVYKDARAALDVSPMYLSMGWQPGTWDTQGDSWKQKIAYPQPQGAAASAYHHRR